MNENDEYRLRQLNFSKDIRSDHGECNGAYETGVELNCDTHGSYQEKEIDLFGRKINISTCPSCVKENNDAEDREAEEIRERDRLKRERVARDNAGVSERNAKVRFKNFVCETSDQQKVYDSVYGFARKIHDGIDAPNVILTGKVGTGKTMIANCVINSLFKVKRVKIIKLQDMLRKVKGSYSKDADYSESDAIDAYASYELLILDEVGVSRDTDNDKNIIFDVLDGRYQKMLPTMIISNLNIDGIKQTLGDRVVDRLRDGGGILLGCDWESFRK